MRVIRSFGLCVADVVGFISVCVSGFLVDLLRVLMGVVVDEGFMSCCVSM